jgi:hypothetical protein
MGHSGVIGNWELLANKIDQAIAVERFAAVETALKQADPATQQALIDAAEAWELYERDRVPSGGCRWIYNEGRLLTVAHGCGWPTPQAAVLAALKEEK